MTSSAKKELNMPTSKHCLLPATIALALMSSASSALAQTAAERAKTQAEIWAKEQAIYKGRAEGDLNFYVDNAAPNYLGWPPSAARPMDRTSLNRDAARMTGQNKEQLTMELAGFTQEGDTAVIYYINHRTMRPDGTPTDQRFENIHVWTRVDGAWRVVGAMSRLEPKRGQ
jgi:hypothetical protein